MTGFTPTNTMDKDYTYYLVTGDPLLSILQEFREQHKASRVALKELVKKYGAEGAFWSQHGVSCLRFKDNKKPKGWIDAKRRGGDYYHPSAKHPQREEIHREFESVKDYGTEKLRDMVTGQDACLMFMHGCTIHGLGMERIGDQFILMYPACPGKEGWGEEVWKVPEEGTELLTEAKYYRLKAEQAEKEAA